jgi:hypothetical protein
MNSQSKKEKKETKMDSRMKMIAKTSVFAAALGLACLLPATAHAQAEVAPDMYELSNTEVAVTQVQVATNSTKPADFQGRFALPYEVRCKGKSLKSGQYLLSVKSEGTGRVVTIAHNGETMTIHAQTLAGNPAASGSALIVRRSHDGRMLEAVYVRQLNTLLFLDSSATTQDGRTERLPIS